MGDELLNKNLDNIEKEYDLFGNEIKKLSIKDRIGFLPISIWRPNWGISSKYKQIIGETGEERKLKGKKMQLMESKYEVSIFNPHLAMMIFSAYCPPNAKVYDPFTGECVLGFIAASMGHKFYGIEIRKEQVDFIEKKKKELSLDLYIKLGDSRKYESFREEFFDFSVSCPPYYNLERYSDLSEDLSNAPTYKEFLLMLKESMKGVYKSLKKNCLSIWIVGNFRDDKTGELIHFNGDMVRLGKEVGFKLHDELIYWGASNVAMLRSGQFEANRKSVRVHEYIIIFKKGE